MVKLEFSFFVSSNRNAEIMAVSVVAADWCWWLLTEMRFQDSLPKSAVVERLGS